MRLKELLKKVFPVSKMTFNYEVERKDLQMDKINEKLDILENLVLKQEKLLQELQNNQNKNLEKNYRGIKEIVDEKSKQRDRDIQGLRNSISDAWSNLNKCYLNDKENRSAILKKLELKQQEADKKFESQFGAIQTNIKELQRGTEENIWAEVYHDTVIKSEWLKDKAFSPGRWAIGYPVMYVLYRVLNEFKPQKILELGLGQSTKMISQYVTANEGVQHKVVEHDEKWISFFKLGNQISSRTQIIQKELGETDLYGKEHIRCYQDFKKDILPNKYDLIFIDAPMGGDMKEFSRVDIVKELPECISEKFVILLDDYNRKGEQNTLWAIKQIFEEKGIEYSVSKYSGLKDTAIITSSDLHFLCSM